MNVPPSRREKTKAIFYGSKKVSSTFDRAGTQARNKVAAEQKKKNHHWDGNEQRARGIQSPLRAEVGLKHFQPEWKSEDLNVLKYKSGDHIFVPGGHEGEERGDDHCRGR